MAYNNSVALASKYVPILDDVYKASARFSVLDTANSDIKFVGANTVLLPKISMDGLGNYSRNDGYVNGAVTLTWESEQLTQDRSRDFVVDVRLAA